MGITRRCQWELCSLTLSSSSNEPQDPAWEPGPCLSHQLPITWEFSALLPALLPADFPLSPGPLFPAQRPLLLVSGEWGGEGPTGQEGGHAPQSNLHGLLQQHIPISEQGCTHGMCDSPGACACVLAAQAWQSGWPDMGPPSSKPMGQSAGGAVRSSCSIRSQLESPPTDPEALGGLGCH